MEMGYVVKAIKLGMPWMSEIFFDAQEAVEELEKCLRNSSYDFVKLYNAYIHYEEIKQNEK